VVDSTSFWWHRFSTCARDFRTAWKGCATKQKILMGKNELEGGGLGWGDETIKRYKFLLIAVVSET
jgi:hypothetical protein